MSLQVRNIHRSDPESHILYRLKYACDASTDTGATEVHFIVEMNPLGERSVYWDSDLKSELFSAEEQKELLGILQGLADNDQLPR